MHVSKDCESEEAYDVAAVENLQGSRALLLLLQCYGGLRVSWKCSNSPRCQGRHSLQSAVVRCYAASTKLGLRKGLGLVRNTLACRCRNDLAGKRWLTSK